MDVFFQVSNSIDVTEIEELLLRKYHDIHYILNLDPDSGIDFIMKAVEKEEERLLWERWLVDYGRMMSPDDFISFNDYKADLEQNIKPTVNRKTKKSIAEIETDVERIINLTLIERGDANGV